MLKVRFREHFDPNVQIISSWRIGRGRFIFVAVFYDGKLYSVKSAGITFIETFSCLVIIFGCGGFGSYVEIGTTLPNGHSIKEGNRLTGVMKGRIG